MSCELANLGGDEVAAAFEVLQKQGFAQLCQAAHPPSVIPRVFHQLEGLVRRAIQARQVVQAVDWVRNEGLEFGVLNIVVPMQEPRYLEPAGKVAIE